MDCLRWRPSSPRMLWVLCNPITTNPIFLDSLCQICYDLFSVDYEDTIGINLGVFASIL